MDTLIFANEYVLSAVNSLKMDASGQVQPDAIVDTLRQMTVHDNSRDFQDVSSHKRSVFNYCMEKPGGCLIYNTLYNSLVRLSTEEYQQYLGEKDAAQDIQDRLLKLGLWVRQDVDEKSVYLAFAKTYRQSLRRGKSVTVTTTMKCNARCIYCYEKGVPHRDMAESAIEPLIRWLISLGKNGPLHITWFGGEPLLNPALMDRIVAALRGADVQFDSYIISNLSKLTGEIIAEKIDFWNVRDVQVTLDGTEEEYARRKNYRDKEEGNFYRILCNIKTLAKKDVAIHIRLNIDSENRENVLELLKEIDPLFSGHENIIYYPAFITGSREKLTDPEKIAFIKEMLSSVKNPNQLTAGRRFYEMPRTNACMNEDPNAYSVDVDGFIYTCEHNVGRQDLALGNVSAVEKMNDTRISSKTDLCESCLQCVFLPKCFGGCASNYRTGDSPCMIEKYFIEAYMSLL